MVTLMEMEGAGTVQRIWMTINDRDPEMLRSLRIDMYWDGVEKPTSNLPELHAVELRTKQLDE